MFNNHVIKLLSAYCNGELPSEKSHRVSEHLLACAACRREYDEIKLGVQLARQLPLASAPAELWSEIETLLETESRKKSVSPRPAKGFAFGWYGVATVSTLLVALAIGVVVIRLPKKGNPPPSGETWEVSSLSGSFKIDSSSVKENGRLGVGGTLETDSLSRARINIAEVGEVEVDPNSRLRLLETRSTEHRLALDRGRIHAQIWAPPRLFFVDTPSAQAIDLGCEYTLQVDDTGRSFLRVTLGWVELVRDGRESYVPIGAMCETRPGIGPGTPYFADANDAFTSALERFDFENGGDEAFITVLNEARPRDTFTLWHLLSRVDGIDRSRVLERMIKLVGLPEGVTRAGVMRLDQEMLDTWKDELDTVWF